MLPAPGAAAPCLTCHSAAQLDSGEVLRAYRGARRRLLVLGYNATLTTAVEAPRQPKRHFDQIKARAAPPCTAARWRMDAWPDARAVPSQRVRLLSHCHCIRTLQIPCC